jgi:hypothetical protein
MLLDLETTIMAIFAMKGMKITHDGHEFEERVTPLYSSSPSCRCHRHVTAAAPEPPSRAASE